MYRADNTILAKWAPCAAAASARHTCGLRGKEPMLAAWTGNAFHAGLEAHFGGGNGLQGEGAFLNEYDRLIVAPGHVVDQERLGRENCRRIFNHYCDTRTLEAFEVKHGKVVELERSVGIKVSDEFEFWMKRDMLVLGLDGMYYPWDNKTTGKVNQWWSGEFSMGSQMSGYCWGTGAERGTVCGGAYINAIEVGKLPDSKTQCKTHKMAYKECALEHTNFQVFYTGRTPAQIAAWYSMACQLATKAIFHTKAYPTVEHLRFVPREGQFIYKACSGCEFKKWCKLDWEPSMWSEFCVEERWEPWESAPQG